MIPTTGQIYEYLAQKAPVALKLDFDNVGLLVGRSDRDVRKVIISLDITDEVIDEAIAARADLIVSHHPLFFELKALSDATWTGARALKMAENRVAGICMHTNLDAASGGVNDALLSAIGALPEGVLDSVTHIGRVGHLDAPIPLNEFLERVKSSLHGNGLRYHDAGRSVYRVGVCGGSGGGEIGLAHSLGCDTYVTADVKYDQFLEAKHLGINLLDADHFCTENVVVPVLCQWLRAAFPEIDVVISRVHRQTACFY